MPAPRHGPAPVAGVLVVLAAAAAAAPLALGGCDPGARLGERCADGDCADGLQCLQAVCVPACARHADCGDGHTCAPDGRCVEVDSDVGDACARELDCGPGQACGLAVEDFDADGRLTAACQPETPGGVLGDACDADRECRTGTCALGRCVDLCVADADCPARHRCATIPRPLAMSDRVAAFAGCLPSDGTLMFRVPMRAPYGRFWLPVPDLARSVALVASVDDPAQLVGAARLESPAGELLYRTPLSREEHFANRVRFVPTRAVSTLVLPQSPQEPLQPGAYAVELGSFRELDVPGTEIPTVDAVYKLGEAVTLRPRFYFLDLDDHPCRDSFDGGTLDAAVAASGPRFQAEFLRTLSVIFARAGVVLDPQDATYTDLRDRPDLDGLTAANLGALLELADGDDGLHVFFVRSIAPAGLQALVGGPPTPPGRAGTRASGLALAADALCYRSWSALARTAAHELARALGLQRSIEVDGFRDTLDDTDASPGNLMYPAELADDGQPAGDDLTAGQRAILRAAPGLGEP